MSGDRTRRTKRIAMLVEVRAPASVSAAVVRREVREALNAKPAWGHEHDEVRVLKVAAVPKQDRYVLTHGGGVRKLDP